MMRTIDLMEARTDGGFDSRFVSLFENLQLRTDAERFSKHGTSVGHSKSLPENTLTIE